MDNNSDTDFIGVVLVVMVVVLAIVAGCMAYDAGFSAGVRAAHHGTHTVTTLPDGSEIVTKAKKD